MVNAALNPAIHSKLALNVRKNLNWSKIGGEKWLTWSRGRAALPHLFNQNLWMAVVQY